jgi:hypothetical protein
MYESFTLLEIDIEVLNIRMFDVRKVFPYNLNEWVPEDDCIGHNM